MTPSGGRRGILLIQLLGCHIEINAFFSCLGHAPGVVIIIIII